MRVGRLGLGAIAIVALACSGEPDESPRPGEEAGVLPAPDAGDAAPERDADEKEGGPEAGSAVDAGRDAREAGPGDASLDALADQGHEDASDSASEEGDAEDLPDAAEDAPVEDDADAGDSAGGAEDADDAEAPGESGAGEEGGQGGEVVVPDEPESLEEAGLYADFATRTLAVGIRPYEPAFKLWSDGAKKDRYVYLPPGSTIDARDPDRWRLPIGTRLYKNFAIGERLVETRLLQKLEGGWFAATYAWNADGSATSRVTGGVRNALGTGYEIPDQTTCKGCHAGASDMALGFELISLANEGATGLNLAALNAEGLLSPPLLGDYTLPGDPLDREALGWLHANCGTACHNDSIHAKGYWTGFWMNLDSRLLDSVESTYAYQTGVGVISSYQPGGPTLYRLFPGRPDRSTVVYRISQRGSTAQMPPMDTNRVDEDGIEVLRAWIEGLH